MGMLLLNSRGINTKSGAIQICRKLIELGQVEPNATSPMQ